MIKRLIRGLIFVFMGLSTANYLVAGLDYGGNYTKNFMLLGIGLILLYYFLKPLLVVVGMPTRGVGFAFLTFVLTFIIIMALTLILSDFSLVDTATRELNILGYVIPSKSLEGLWPGVAVALVISVVYAFMEGLCSKR